VSNDIRKPLQGWPSRPHAQNNLETSLNKGDERQKLAFSYLIDIQFAIGTSEIQSAVEVSFFSFSFSFFLFIFHFFDL